MTILYVSPPKHCVSTEGSKSLLPSTADSPRAAAKVAMDATAVSEEAAVDLARPDHVLEQQHAARPLLTFSFRQIARCFDASTEN